MVQGVPVSPRDMNVSTSRLVTETQTTPPRRLGGSETHLTACHSTIANKRPSVDRELHASHRHGYCTCLPACDVCNMSWRGRTDPQPHHYQYSRPVGVVGTIASPPFINSNRHCPKVLRESSRALHETRRRRLGLVVVVTAALLVGERQPLETPQSHTHLILLSSNCPRSWQMGRNLCAIQLDRSYRFAAGGPA